MFKQLRKTVKMLYFVFNRRQKVIEVWNGVRIQFWVNLSKNIPLC